LDAIAGKRRDDAIDYRTDSIVVFVGDDEITRRVETQDVGIVKRSLGGGSAVTRITGKAVAGDRRDDPFGVHSSDAFTK
jgi:hypothetical protein